MDVGRLLDQVDLNRLIDRVDPDRLLDRVDLDRLLAQVDLDRALSTVDVKALTARSGIPEVVAESTSRMAGSALDVARRQVAGLDLLIDRGLRRRPATIKPGPQRLLGATSEEGRYSVTGYYAGPLSRAVGAVLDAIIVFATFTLGFAAVNLLSTVVLGISLDQNRTGIVATVAFAVVVQLLLRMPCGQRSYGRQGLDRYPRGRGGRAKRHSPRRVRPDLTFR